MNYIELLMSFMLLNFFSFVNYIGLLMSILNFCLNFAPIELLMCVLNVLKNLLPFYCQCLSVFCPCLVCFLNFSM
jgi:hypothetical protein